MEVLKNIKTRVLLSVLSIALAAIAGWNIVESQNKIELSDLALANVEALAQGEGSSSITANCDPISVVVTSKCVVICPRCYKEWRPSGSPTGKTDISSIRGCCSCGYCF